MRQSLFGTYGFRRLEPVMVKQSHGGETLHLDLKVGEDGRERAGRREGEREGEKERNWKWCKSFETPKPAPSDTRPPNKATPPNPYQTVPLTED